MVRLIDADGEQVGIISIAEAQRQARLAGLDLVEVSPQAQPPVCRILDYGKYQYEQAKKEKEQKKGKKKTDTKEIKIGFKTGEHDQELKINKTEEFLKDGDKVKVMIVLRGREKAHRDLARQIIQEFLSKIKTPYRFEEALSGGPSGFSATISADKKKAS